MLRLTQTIADAMMAHAVRGAPWEACGLFAGPYRSNHVMRFVPMTNAAASAEIYRLDGQEHLDVERSFEADGMSVIGVMHSHVHTSPYPSATDIAEATRFDPFGSMHFVIVSLARAEPVLRNFQIFDGSVREIPVSITEQ